MADTSGEVRDLIHTFFTTQWEALAPTDALLFYTNQEGNRPEEPVLWGRLHVQFIDRMQVSLGSVADGIRFRGIGTIFLQVFVPLGVGTDEYDTLCDAVVVALENQAALDNVWLRDIGMREIGSDGTYFQTNVECAFQWDRNT